MTYGAWSDWSAYSYSDWSAYSAYSEYTYSAWSAYSAYTGYTYSAWGEYGAWSACDSTGTWTDVTENYAVDQIVTFAGVTWKIGTIYGFAKYAYVAANPGNGVCGGQNAYGYLLYTCSTNSGQKYEAMGQCIAY